MKNKLKHLINEMMIESVLKDFQPLKDFHFDIIVDINFDEPIRFNKYYGVEIPTQDYMNALFEIDSLSNEINDAIRLKKNLYSVNEVYDYLKGRYKLTLNAKMENSLFYEDAFSRGFIFKILGIGDKCYCLFQLRIGTDFRLGYTKARIFKIANINAFCSNRLVRYYIEKDNTNKEFDNFRELKDYARKNVLEIAEKNGLGYLGGKEINYDLLYKKVNK